MEKDGDVARTGLKKRPLHTPRSPESQKARRELHANAATGKQPNKHENQIKPGEWRSLPGKDPPTDWPDCWPPSSPRTIDPHSNGQQARAKSQLTTHNTQLTTNNKPQRHCRCWTEHSELATAATFIKNVISSENSLACKWKRKVWKEPGRFFGSMIEKDLIPSLNV
uniref:HDC02141 n=1 Tax=Drosophila melanogaster TaxID=7227 RepID=Q6IHM8_DROME|nr:TPA_inf: HDC02141 [Drosophila melanogaster]